MSEDLLAGAALLRPELHRAASLVAHGASDGGSDLGTIELSSVSDDRCAVDNHQHAGLDSSRLGLVDKDGITLAHTELLAGKFDYCVHDGGPFSW